MCSERGLIELSNYEIIAGLFINESHQTTVGQSKAKNGINSKNHRNILNWQNFTKITDFHDPQLVFK